MKNKKSINEEVVITNQSFREAGCREEFSNLECIGMIEYHKRRGVLMGKYNPIEELNKGLANKAKLIGATHVFKTEYYLSHSTPGFSSYAIGSAYGPKE